MLKSYVQRSESTVQPDFHPTSVKVMKKRSMEFTDGSVCETTQHCFILIEACWCDKCRYLSCSCTCQYSLIKSNLLTCCELPTLSIQSSTRGIGYGSAFVTRVPSFQWIIHMVIDGLEGCEAYINDIIVCSDTWEQHMQ